MTRMIFMADGSPLRSGKSERPVPWTGRRRYPRTLAPVAWSRRARGSCPHRAPREGSGLDELVPDLVHRHDERLRKARAQLGAQIGHVRVHGARGDSEVLVDAPDLLEQLLARHGAPAVLDQILEQLELFERKRHLLAGFVC